MQIQLRLTTDYPSGLVNITIDSDTNILTVHLAEDWPGEFIEPRREAVTLRFQLTPVA